MSLEIKSEIIARSKPQRFREGGRLHRNVRIYLHSSSEQELDKIESVQYELHPTFRDRYRSCSNRTRNFEIRIWSYGYFKIKAVLKFKDGNSKNLEGFVKW